MTPQRRTSDAVAVLTGDLVGSSRLDAGDRQRLGQAIRDAVAAAKGVWDSAIPYPVDIFRGDSWQLVIISPGIALSAAVYLRARLRLPGNGVPGLQTRVGIGVGEMDYAPSPQSPSGGGAAFERSGHALDALGGRTYLGLRTHDAEPSDAGAVDVVVDLVDAVTTRWSEGQCRAVVGTMEGLKQQEIGDAWPDNPITQQAVADHLGKAAWKPVSRALDFFDRALEISGCTSP